MVAQLTQFGLACRQHRLMRNRTIGDQAEALGCSASFVSAIERGLDPLPSSYLGRLSVWLELQTFEAKALEELIADDSNIVAFPRRDRNELLSGKFGKFLQAAPPKFDSGFMPVSRERDHEE